jgi:NAD(P)-dependent dehydrogenase (short-subunit alcohol dehydrogenase family)
VTRALVIGGTSGIGLAVARGLAATGADTTIAGRRADGPAIAEQAGCRFVSVDVDDPDTIEAALTVCAPLDVLVLNAGRPHAPRPIAGVSPGSAQRVVTTNLMGTFHGLRLAGEHLADGASVIVTSSISAVMASPFEGLYGATTAAVSALVRSAAVDLGPRGIRVNAVQPGPTWTDMNPMPEEWIATLAPVGRKAVPEDMVGTYLFLASDASRHMTGQALTVDGGMTLGVSQALLGVLASQAEMVA